MGPFARALVEGSALVSLPLVSLAIFLLTFTAVVVRAFATSRSQIDAISRIPLDDEEGR